MAVTAWGQTFIQATMPAESPVRIGSIWVDTANTLIKQCTAVSPYTFATVSGASASALLDSTAHTDTTTGAVARGDLITGQGATPKWVRLAKGAANRLLKSDGTDLAWSQVVNADVDPAAAIAYSKLSLTGSIVNADVNASAAIATSKLDLSTDIVFTADGVGLRRNTSNGSDTGYISMTGGGAVNDATRGGSLTLFGNEFGSGFGGHAQFVCGDHADSKIRLYRGDVAVMLEIANAVDSVSFPKGQLKFPASQNASADANTIDDYEEGFFTAGVSFGGGTTGLTYAAATNESRYVKIGKNIFATGYLALSAKGSSTGLAKITGFPFTAEAAYAVGHIGMFGTFTGLTGTPQFYVNTGATAGDMYQTGAASVAQVTDAHFTDTTSFYFFVFYRAAA